MRQLDLIEEAWLAQHQRGWLRLPWATASTPANTPSPAWVCCHCGGVARSRYLLMNDHGCEPGRCMPLDPDRPRRCTLTPPRRDDDQYWIPPEER